MPFHKPVLILLLCFASQLHAGDLTEGKMPNGATTRGAITNGTPSNQEAVSRETVNREASKDVINVCDDAAEFPPYIYQKRNHDGSKSSLLMGGMTEILNAIAQRTNLTFNVTLLPWARCIAEVKQGKNYEMLMNAVQTKERSDFAYESLPIYFMSSGYWYSKERFPDGLMINTLKQLKNHSIIAIHGYSYKKYGIEEDAQNIVGKAKNYANAFKMLTSHRGDIILGGQPIAYGFEAIGQSILKPQFTWQKIKDSKPTGFHIYISKRSFRSKSLLTQINQAISDLNQHGKIHEILMRHVPCGQDC